jgi:hypothetical protein
MNSTTTTTATTATTKVVVPNNDDDENSHNNNDDTPPKEANNTVVLFPWRHQLQPLPRFIPGTMDHAVKPHLLSSTKMKPGNVTLNAYASAFMFLDVPLYQFFFFSSWKEDIANSMSWAFTQGVGGLLSKLPHHPNGKYNII